MRKIKVIVSAFFILSFNLAAQDKVDNDKIQERFESYLRYTGEQTNFAKLYQHYPEIGKKVLLKKLEDSNDEVRRFAIHYIWHTKDSLFVPILVSLAKSDKNIDIRRTAIIALGSIDAYNSAKELGELLLYETDELLQQEILYSLKALTYFETIETIKVFIEQIKHALRIGLKEQAQSILFLLQRYWGGEESRKALFLDALSVRRNSDFNWAKSKIERKSDPSFLSVLRISTSIHIEQGHSEEAILLLRLRAKLNEGTFTEKEQEVIKRWGLPSG
ncbi:MAG: HEAT repeat domain-containing protein [Saprospiraceae bacterium]